MIDKDMDWIIPEEGYDFGDEIDHAMDTKAEQEMLADIEHERENDESDDPEADAADAAAREADTMFLAYQADRRRTVLTEPVDQSLAYEPNDPKGKHALGWNHD